MTTPNRQPRTLKARLMRFLAPTLIGGFLVIGAAGAFGVWRGARQNITQVHDVALAQIGGEIANELNRAFGGVRAISTGGPAQAFALETVALSGSQVQLLQAQNALTQQMIDLIESGRGDYTSVRYIMRTGSVWTEVTQEGDAIAVDTDFSLREVNPDGDVTLSGSLNAEFGTVLLSPVQPRMIDGIRRPYVNVYSPVTRPNDPNSVLGVIHLQIEATTLLNIVNNALADPITGADGRRYLMINNRNQILADTGAVDRVYLAALDGIEPNNEPDDAALFEFLFNTPGQITNAGQGRNIITSRLINLGDAADMPWRLLIIDDTFIAFGNSNVLAIIVLLSSLSIGALTLFIADRLVAGNLRGVGTASNLLRQLSMGEAASPMHVATTEATSGDEDRQMIENAQRLANQIQDLSQRIDAQSQQYERNLKVAARIGRETAALENIDELLQRAINMICTSFGLYHAQVFLVDEAGVDAVLVYSRGEAGRKMLEQDHKLAVGSASVIGRVTASGHPVVVNDTTSATAEGQHAFNPLLPDTRAEMALPLQIGERIIGALDLQSDKPNAFRPEDQQTYQLLADQLAIAVNKTQLLRQSDERIQQIETLNRQLTQMAWEEMEDEMGLDLAYRYNLLEVTTGDIATEELDTRTANLLSVPIEIRGEMIGTLTAAPPEDLQFTDNDRTILLSVAERVSLAIENARLFQETQTNLAETNLLYRTSRNLNEADTLSEIIEAILTSAITQAQGGVVFIFEEYNQVTGPAWLEINATYVDPDQASESVQAAADRLVGLRMHMDDHTMLRELNGNVSTLVEDMVYDQRVNAAFREILADLNARAVAFIPLMVRATWRGAVMLFFSEPRTFNEREGRVFGHLADQAGVAIDNRLLLRQTESALLQNERLYAGSRMINQAQGLEDLVRAAVVTTDQPDLNFGLALFEGDLDDTGWPSQLNHLAQSRNGGLYEPRRVYDMTVPENSPMRERESIEIFADEPNTVLHTIIMANGDLYGVVFPLFSANQPTALFIVSRKEAAPISEEDHEIYRALTGMMSTVIQNRSLLESTAAALDETRRLYEASQAINDAQDMEITYRAAVVHLAMAITQLTRITVLLARPEPGHDAPYLEVGHAWGRSDDLTLPTIDSRLESRSVPLGPMLKAEGRAVYIANLNTPTESWASIHQFIAEHGAASALVLPLDSRQGWLGALVLESDEINAFDPAYRRYSQAIADQMAIAVANQMLFEQAQQEARQALALAEASQLAAQISGEFREGIDSLFTRVAETAGYDRWLMMLNSQTKPNNLERITQRVPSGHPALAPEMLNLSAADHVIADAVRFNRTLMINNPMDNPIFADTPEQAQVMGKHLTTPIIIGNEIVGALLMGRSPDKPDMTDRDETLITTLAAQVAVSLENQRLFLAAEVERNTLRSILNTLPAGVLVLDAKTLRPIQSNAQAAEFLGTETLQDAPTFDAASYGLLRTGTNSHYPDEELPIFIALANKTTAFCDDVSVFHEDGTQIDLLINAAPIVDSSGEVSTIVAAFEDISNLRSMENTLQDNLRETITLYEATRSFAEADELDEVLDVVMFQLMLLETEDAHILLLNEDSSKQVARSKVIPLAGDVIPDAVLDNRDYIFVDDVENSMNLSTQDRYALQSSGINAIGTLPLRGSKREVPLGWLVITYSTEHRFTSDQRRFLESLSSSAAVAIDNRYLFQSTQNALRETMSLYGATTTISRARDSEDLASVLRTALEQLSPDVYAGYLMTNPSTPDQLTELFNISMDGATVDFHDLLLKFGLFREEEIFIEDLLTIENPSPFEQALIDMGHIRAFGSVSLRVKGMPDGRLFVGYHQPHRFGVGDSRYFTAVADSASVVVDNIILLEQVQSALEETSTLYQASRALADATQPEDILEVVVEKLIDTHVTQVFVALLRGPSWENEASTVSITASWQKGNILDLTGITFTKEQFPAWTLLASPSVLTVDDVNTDKKLDDVQRAGIESLDTRAVTIIPLRVPSRAIGAVWIGSKEAHYHSEREQRVYQAFAEQASLSLEASYLLEQTERRARQLATSAQVSQIVSSILDLDSLLPEVVNLIKNEFTYDHAQVFLMDENNEYAELKASTGEAGKQLIAIGHKLARGSASVIGQVTERAEPVIALDTAESNVVHRPNIYLPLTRSEMALPILVKGQVIGALDVQSNMPNAFGPDDITVLTTLAAQIAVAIENARLFNEAEQRADEMSFLFTITTAAASAENLEEALGNVVELLSGTLDAVSVGIYLIEPGAGPRDPDTVRIVALSGSSQPFSEVEQFTVGDPDNLIGVTAAEAVPVIVDDIAAEPRYLPLVPEARSAAITPLSGSGGKLAGLIVLESDRVHQYFQETLTLLLALGGTLAAIVESSRLLDQVQQQRDDLLQLDQLKSAFLANMSHELRTPLNSIIGFSRVMLKGIDGPLSEMQEQDLTTIYNSGQHLLGLINDILDNAKIAANKMDLQRDYFDVKAVAEGVRSIGIGLVKEKPVDILLETTNNLPQGFGDEFRTRQVLLNVVSNAAKFTSEGSITIRVYTITDAVLGEMIRIDIADTGIGIDKKDMPLLFESFRQVDSSLTRTHEGTGLGLPIAKSLVELQGGEMSVESAMGVGSTFSVTVPTQPVIVETDDHGTVISVKPSPNGASADDTESTHPVREETVETTTVVMQDSDGGEQKRTKLAGGPPPGVFQQKRQALLIEDNPAMVDQFRKLLQREGFEVFTASIPLEAEAMASGLRPTLIVMDVDFADGKGWGILEQIKDRDDTFDIPVIVVTLNEDSERAYQLGAHSFMPRPFMPDDLLKAVLEAERESNVDRILIIDDQLESTRLLEQLLQENGNYKVFAAQTGPEGISLVARRQPDLIILDLRMPNMDGFAVLEELQQNPETAQIPVMVVTSDTTMTEDERSQLVNLQIVYKTDLNQQNYQQFIDEVRKHISDYHGE